MKQVSFFSLLKAVIFITAITTVCFTQWEQQFSNSTYNLYSIYFIDPNTGFISSSSNINQQPQFLGGEILKTTNAGINWNRVLLDSTFRGRDFHFFNINTGYAIGGFYASLGKIYKTTNGGNTWLGDTLSKYLFNVQFLDAQNGFLSVLDGVLKTTNGGNSWSRILTADNPNIKWSKVFFTDINNGYFTVAEGQIYKTVNGGANWTNSNVQANIIYDISFINSNTGYITADSGRIYKTINAGSNWSALSSGVNQNLFSFFNSGSNTIYVTGENVVLKSTNEGSSWSSVFNEPADSLFSSYFLDANTGYTCGDDGKVYKTTTGGVIGINPISTEVPNDFALGQNYPNPFNPTTNIKFALPKAGFVKLAVYDMLGREMESLVSQHMNPGTYVVDWNAAKFSSGIYMYKLTTNDFSMVKKMSLIK